MHSRSFCVLYYFQSSAIAIGPWVGDQQCNADRNLLHRRCAFAYGQRLEFANRFLINFLRCFKIHGNVPEGLGEALAGYQEPGL